MLSFATVLVRSGIGMLCCFFIVCVMEVRANAEPVSCHRVHSISRMNYHLILTLDYEVFGNGSGCLCHCVVEPVDKVLALLEEYAAGLHCFVDATEFAAMSAHADHRDAPFDVRCLSRVEEQIATLGSAPHSVQLHIHPQWIGASVREGKWLLDYDRWRIGNLPRREIDHAITSGIRFLERHIDRSDERNCQCFRAGGWGIQPAAEVLSSLAQHGVRMDSTVAPGTRNRAQGDWFDFRRAPDTPYWYSDTDILLHSGSGVLEVPITTARLGRVAHAKILRESRNSGFPTGCSGSYDGPNSRLQSLAGKLGKLANMGVVMLDFSTLPAWALIEITQRYMSRFSAANGPIPIVAIGHNKNFSRWSEINLRQYLEWVAGQSELTFSSYSKWFVAATSGRAV